MLSFNIEALTPFSCYKQAFCVHWTRTEHMYRTLRQEHERGATGARTTDEHGRRGRATNKCKCGEHGQGTQRAQLAKHTSDSIAARLVLSCCSFAVWLALGCCSVAARLLLGRCSAAARLVLGRCLAAAWLLLGCCSTTLSEGGR